MSGKSTRRWLRSAALALFLSAAGPLTAQTSTVTVQNNRSVPVRIYLDNHPLELKLGTVGPMETMTLESQQLDLDEGRHLGIALD